MLKEFDVDYAQDSPGPPGPALILCRRQNPAENRAQLLTESFETATPIVYSDLLLSTIEAERHPDERY